MTQSLPEFTNMWKNYPDASKGKDAVVHDIGGNLEQSVNQNPDAWNSCTIRLSHSFNYAGHLIPSKHILKKSLSKEVMSVKQGGDQLWYAYRVEDMKFYVQEIFGPEDGKLHVTKGGQGVSANKLPSKKLLVFFRFLDESHKPKPQWASHADLWDGSAMRYNNILEKEEHSDIHVTYWEFD